MGCREEIHTMSILLNGTGEGQSPAVEGSPFRAGGRWVGGKELGVEDIFIMDSGTNRRRGTSVLRESFKSGTRFLVVYKMGQTKHGAFS